MKLKPYILSLLLILSVSSVVSAKGVGTTMFSVLQLPASAYDGALAYTTVAGEYSAIQNPSIVPFRALFRKTELSVEKNGISRVYRMKITVDQTPYVQ